MFIFWWLAKRFEQKMSTEMQKTKKGPLSHWKIKCSFLDYIQLLMIDWAMQVKIVNQNAKNRKGPLSHQKIKCLFWIMFNFWWSAKRSELKTLTEMQKNKKGPLIIKKSNVCLWIMFNFWWPARLVNGLKLHLPPLSSPKNEMFIFGLHSTSDDQLSNLSKKCQPKCKKWKRPPKW